jgi:DNA-binding LacI/PurR family transcriptional regulator/signal transduction histidine kinase/ActR/RegA family two-component response regulator
VTRKTIAVLIDHLDHLQGGYSTQVCAGLEQAAATRDVNLLLFAGREIDSGPQSDVYTLIHRGNADAVVFVSAGLCMVSGTAGLVRLAASYGDLPTCSLGVAVPGIPSIVTDDRPGMDTLFDHLVLDHGTRRIAFLSGNPNNSDNNTRLTAYHEALARHGIAFDRALLVTNVNEPTSGRLAIDTLFQRGASFDAVVATNDAVAIGALQALNAHGISVPRDVTLTGFDDLGIARFTDPPLTTVRQPIRAMAARAVDLVCDQLEGHDVPSLTQLPVQFVRRSSCGCTAGAGNSDAPSHPYPPPTPAQWLSREREELTRRLQAYQTLVSDQLDSWINPFLDALHAEFDGRAGALVEALEASLANASDSDRAFDQLQQGLCLLRDRCVGLSQNLEPLWISAERALAAASTVDQARNRIGLEMGYKALLHTSERLALTFDRESLRQVLQAELPDLVKSAFVSLTDPEDPTQLQAFFGFTGGVVHDLGVAPFRADRLVPPGAPEPRTRWTQTVLPLTVEGRTLGLAVVEQNLTMGVAEMLRAQISSALEGASLHQEIVKKTAQHGRMEQEKRATAERLNSLSVLAGGVAHDLNNSLAPLVSLPELMLTNIRSRPEQPGDAELADDLKAIKDAALRATRTIKDLLTLGRQGRTHKEPLELNRVVRSIFAADALVRQQAAARGVQVGLELTSDALGIAGAESQLARAVSNLLRNAIDAIDGEGTVTLRTRVARISSPFEAYEVIDPGEYTVLEVTDTGNGIPEHEMGRIFEPFFTTKRAGDHSGTGLGLAIVHAVIKEHHGFADVHSEAKRGTTFTLYLPRRAISTEFVPIAPSLNQGNGRVLVVDDELAQLRTARRVLSRYGYDVVTAGNSAEALQTFIDARHAGAPFELLVVDVNLGEIEDGIALLERIRVVAPGQKGLVISGHAANHRIDRALAEGFGFVSKPYRAETLARAAERALGGAPAVANDEPASFSGEWASTSAQ